MNDRSFSIVLFLIFLVLKLTAVISWSWWWVTAPLWIYFLLVLVVVSFFSYQQYKFMKNMTPEQRQLMGLMLKLKHGRRH